MIKVKTCLHISSFVKKVPSHSQLQFEDFLHFFKVHFIKKGGLNSAKFCKIPPLFHKTHLDFIQVTFNFSRFSLPKSLALLLSIITTLFFTYYKIIFDSWWLLCTQSSNDNHMQMFQQPDSLSLDGLTFLRCLFTHLVKVFF